MLIETAGLAGVAVPRPVGNYVLGWAGLVMGLAVLHQVTGAILVAAAAASLHRLGRTAA